MELKQAIGSRRTIRFFKPWRPVEKAKIQVILEAANRSSRSMNADYVKAIVVNRDELSPELRDTLRNPTTSLSLDLAPTYIMWFINLNYPDGTKERLKELVDHDIQVASQGWSHAYVDETIQRTVIEKITGDESRLQWMGAIESGQAIAQAMLAAVDEGLGCALHNFADAGIREPLGVPDHWRRAWIMLLGYPLEEPEAGGQRPRRPLSENFFWGDAHTPFEDDPEVTEQLKQDGMIQTPSPLPWRRDEMRAINRMLGLAD
jgi:nitroreductase